MGQTRAGWKNELGAMISLAVPVVLSELGWVAQGVVDNIMVGRLGPVAIGAVALGNAVYYTPALFELACCWAWIRWFRRPTAGAITMNAIGGWHRVCIWPALRRHR